MTEPLVSVIVPVYNVEKYLGDCVNSIMNQTYRNLEIILVNDGSPDKCPELCDEYAKLDSRIRVIHKANGGPSSARNAALDIMSGEYCMFVDSDDFIHPKTVEICVKFAVEHQWDIVEFLARKQHERELPAINENNIHFTEYNNHSIFTSAAERVILCCKLIRSSLWNGVRMPEGKLNEDDATTWKLYFKSKCIGQLDIRLYLYYINSTGICSNQAKKPNIEYPLSAYHERIEYFSGKGERNLLTVSKWRLLKYIVLSFKNSNLGQDQRKILMKEYKKNVLPVICSSCVPFKQKVLFSIFPIAPAISKYAHKRK